MILAAATAWFVIATQGRDGIWNRCVYDAANEPVAPPVVPVTPKPDEPKIPALKKVSGSNSDVAIGDDTTEEVVEDTGNPTGPGDDTVVAPIRGNDDSEDDSEPKDVGGVNGWAVAGGIAVGAGIAGWLIVLVVRRRHGE